MKQTTTISITAFIAVFIPIMAYFALFKSYDVTVNGKAAELSWGAKSELTKGLNKSVSEENKLSGTPYLKININGVVKELRVTKDYNPYARNKTKSIRNFKKVGEVYYKIDDKEYRYKLNNSEVKTIVNGIIYK